MGCMRSKRADIPQLELENVARCFHAATSLLQAEPDSPSQFAEFLLRAKATAESSGSIPAGVDFAALRWKDDGKALETESGASIACRISKQEHDNYGDAGTAWLTEYEFYIPNTEFRTQTSIELSMSN